MAYFVQTPVIKVFPSALRTVKPEGKYTSENNLTGIIRSVVDRDSYIIKWEDGDKKIVIYGYYFEFTTIPGSWTNNLYCSIVLDSSDRLVGFDGQNVITDNLDSGSSSDGSFYGLILDTTTVSVPGYKVKSLQILANGQLVTDNFFKFNTDSLNLTNLTTTINGLGTSKTITELKEVNGLISATVSDISIDISQVSGLNNSLSGKADASHAHGNIANGGTISSSVVTPASGDYLLISDSSGDNKIERGIAITSGTSKFLRQNGTWATPSGTYELGTASNNNIGGIKTGYPEPTGSGRNYPVKIEESGTNAGKAYVNVPWTDNNTTYSAGIGLNLTSNQFKLKPASTSEIGGIRTDYSQSGKNYPVKTDENGKAYVNVPWTDNNTTYSAGTNIEISNSNVISVKGVIDITNGGTGETTALGARQRLRIFTSNQWPINTANVKDGDIYIIY